MPGAAHAIRMHAYGPPQVLALEPVALAPLEPGDVRVRTLAAAVNFTDLKIRAGAWPVRRPQPFPYVPGVEAVGTIEEVGAQVTDWSVGDKVITMMQGLGGVRGERYGGYAQFVTVDAQALARVPDAVDPIEMAALGLGAVTAYQGLRRCGSLQGRRVLVTGAAGGVGSAAISIARVSGAASVIGVVRRAEQAAYVRSLGADEVIVGEPPGASADAVLDTVGGSLFGACVAALRDGGTLSLVGAVAGGEVALDAWHLIRPVTLTGYSTETLRGDELREAVAALTRWLGSAAIRAPHYQVLALRDAAEAHRLLEHGGVSGRLLLRP
jgi:NADPH2:quinone reductase